MKRVHMAMLAGSALLTAVIAGCGSGPAVPVSATGVAVGASLSTRSVAEREP